MLLRGECSRMVGSSADWHNRGWAGWPGVTGLLTPTEHRVPPRAAQVALRLRVRCVRNGGLRQRRPHALHLLLHLRRARVGPAAPGAVSSRCWGLRHPVPVGDTPARREETG